MYEAFSIALLCFLFLWLRHKKNEETVTVELSKQFKQLVSTAVSKFVPDGEEDRFSEELECFVASKLSIEAYDLSYEESSKEGQNGVDYDLLRWIQQKVNLMQIQNTDFLSTRCLNFGKQIDSSCVWKKKKKKTQKYRTNQLYMQQEKSDPMLSLRSDL